MPAGLEALAPGFVLTGPQGRGVLCVASCVPRSVAPIWTPRAALCPFWWTFWVGTAGWRHQQCPRAVRPCCMAWPALYAARAIHLGGVVSYNR
jgi:hypothetical protein